MNFTKLKHFYPLILKRKIPIIILLLLNEFVYGQNLFSLLIVQTDTLEVEKIKQAGCVKKFSNEGERNKELNNVILSLYQQGHLALSVDSIKKDSLNFTAFLRVGKYYRWAKIRPGNIGEDLLDETGFSPSYFNNKEINGENLKNFFERIIIFCENHGYPFASVKLDSIQMEDRKEMIKENGFEGIIVSAALNLSKNNFFLIDSVILNGNARISEKFIRNYINLKPGDLYNEDLILKIPVRMKELSFLSQKKPPVIIFSESQSKLFLFADEKKASSVNGVMGILPQGYKTGKTQIIGDARVKLINPLGKGELLDINWRKMQTGTNDLKIIINYPFLFNTPFGADLSFKLYKRDTTFIDINQIYGLQYLLKGGNFFKAFAGSQKSNLISTKGLEKITVLPPYADIAIYSYGVGFKAEKLDYRNNPRKGFFIDLTGSAGNKQIKKNLKVNAVIYDSLKLKSVQYNARIDFEGFIPLLKRSTLKFGVKSGYLLNNTLFQNELFRIGGFKTLRGFDEESISSSGFSIFTFEYRFLLEQNSFFHVFFDGAYYENLSISFHGDRYDTPYGFGTGISFETKAGIFSLDYALGKQFSNPLLLKTGKIHFGFVNYF